MSLDGFSSLLAEWQHEECIGGEGNAGSVWRLLGIAQCSTKKAQLLGCSQAKGKGQSTHGVVCFSLMSPVLSTVCHGVTVS